jgi:hypothetical protein
LLRRSRVPGAARFLSVIRQIVIICVETLLPSSFFKYDRHMFRTITLFLALTATAFGQNSAKDEAQVWELEKAYWEYVKANDLEKYRALWHENFVGWPFVSTEGSHHRLDYFEHVKRDQAPVVLNRAACHSGNWRCRDGLLSN